MARFTLLAGCSCRLGGCRPDPAGVRYPAPMNSLPSSIETALQEAGFTPTEVMILKHLVEEPPTTVRQLASKTGKSTGVIDQAMKKLLKKGIVAREVVNDTPRYAIHSLESIMDWMEEDTKWKREMLIRRHQNFESFVSSLTIDRDRPDVAYFEGAAGLKQAYMKLLECNSKEMLSSLPVTHKEEEDPLRDFRVQYFRERRKRGIVLRVLAHNTPLSRRFQSRDVFEYRKTVLLPADRYPIPFEKIVIGDTLACFDHKAEKACLIRFPQLAEAERRFFDMIWGEYERLALENQKDDAEPKLSEEISLKTRVLSGAREFFLSRKSIATFVICGVLAAFFTFILYKHNVYLNTQRIRERAMSIAATGTLDFAAEELDELRTVEDIKKPVYADVIRKLNEIRNQNPSVAFVYIMRPTARSSEWEFVADADSIDPFVKKDLNGDGIIDEEDHLSPPGEKYSDPDVELMKFALKAPFASEASFHTQWGELISGWAGISDREGNAVAVLGVDFSAEQIAILSKDTFAPIYSFTIIFVLFVFMRLAAFNKPFIKELSGFLKSKFTPSHK